jgi:hypothetical protein
LMLPLEGRPDKQFAEELLKKSQDQD